MVFQNQIVELILKEFETVFAPSWDIFYGIHESRGMETMGVAKPWEKTDGYMGC
jgi:hypothetical protein